METEKQTGVYTDTQIRLRLACYAYVMVTWFINHVCNTCSIYVNISKTIYKNNGRQHNKIAVNISQELVTIISNTQISSLNRLKSVNFCPNYPQTFYNH